MRVLLVPGTGLAPQHGGQSSFCRYLAEGLLELNHSVEIGADEGWAEFCKQKGIALRSSHTPSLNGIDVVHVNGPGIREAALGLVLGKKVVMTHQDYRYLCPANTAWTPDGCSANGTSGPCQFCPARDVRSRAHTRMLRTTAAFCSNVAVSSYALKRLSLPHGHAILSPIRAEPNPAPRDSGLIAFAGRLAPEKGVTVLIHALAQLRDARLEIAGDGPMLPLLRQLVTKLGLETRVRFLGDLPLELVRDLYRRSSVVCVPSIWCEPFGYAAAEALALGRALVASDRGAFPELVGRTRGWLCRAEDPSDWANTLRTVLEDDDERARRCREAVHFVATELDPLPVARRYTALYEKHLGD
jgi:glycosyltransferase involved in cell wall biosynthesis